MIISRTPFRISFFGGGTDYPGWFRENGGSVLATTIDKYCYITCRYLPPVFEYRSRIVYSKVEMVQDNIRIEHPAVRAALQLMGVTQGVEIHHDGDLPARTGLGSSSSFAVGVLHALYALKQKMPDKMMLARGAIHLEQEVLKENVGCQDQIMAAMGGLLRVDFRKDGAFEATPVIISRQRIEELHSHLMLYFTGFSRIASTIVKEQLENMKDRRRELQRIQRMVDDALGLLTGSGDLADFGRLLDEAWSLKRSLSSKISLPAVDEIYDIAKKSGALGGKLLGAGGGGFLLLFARPADKPKIQERLRHLLNVPFRFDNEGTRIILYNPDGA